MDMKREKRGSGQGEQVFFEKFFFLSKDWKGRDTLQEIISTNRETCKHADGPPQPQRSSTEQIEKPRTQLRDRQYIHS